MYFDFQCQPSGVHRNACRSRQLSRVFLCQLTPLWRPTPDNGVQKLVIQVPGINWNLTRNTSFVTLNSSLNWRNVLHQLRLTYRLMELTGIPTMKMGRQRYFNRATVSSCILVFRQFQCGRSTFWALKPCVHCWLKLFFFVAKNHIFFVAHLLFLINGGLALEENNHKTKWGYNGICWLKKMRF